VKANCRTEGEIYVCVVGFKLTLSDILSRPKEDDVMMTCSITALQMALADLGPA
jgi:hypothetical protein